MAEEPSESASGAAYLAALWKREVECRMIEWVMENPYASSTTRQSTDRYSAFKSKMTRSEGDNTKTAEAKKFWDDMVEFCQRAARGELESRNGSSVNLPEMLPEDPVSAIRLVLDQEIRSMWTDKGLLQVTDTLGEYDVPNYKPPFWYDPDTGRSGLKAAFKHARIPARMWNPLVRFQFQRMNAKDLLEDQYVKNGSADSVAFRAIVGHAACLLDGDGAACFQCSARKVRWNGYFDNASVQYRYWKKLVCENCDSVYEIKSARTIEFATHKIDNGIDGGNFLEEYVVVQQELRDASRGRGQGENDIPVARQFVALLVTEETVQRDGKECWPVYAAAVELAIPQFKDRSFERNDDLRPKVYTRIFCERPSSPVDALKPWFHIPVFQFDFQEMAAEIVESL